MKKCTMREIDTDAQVVWPAWCYSGDIDSEILPEIEAEPTEAQQNHRKNRSLKSQRHRTKKEQGTPKEAVVAGEKSSHFQQQQQQQKQHGVVQSSLPSSFVFNKFQSSSDKMLSDRMVIGFNTVDNNKKHCDNHQPTTNLLLLDKIKNESQMDSVKNGELLGNNNNNNNNNSANSVNNSSSNNNSIKRERLSPPTNGDVQSSISRSRSATPSSFPGTPPQPTNPNEPGQGLSTSTLSAVQARASEFQARNYSDFMRSLAAKYNNPNDSQRNMLFEAAKFASSKSSVKESPSPPDIKRPNLPNLTPPQAPQVSSNPFVSSLLSSLPFSPAVFPPLIDMSSTQALVTLARAAKEAEIQNILRSAQKRPTTMQRRSPSSRASLTPTPQQSTPQFPVQPFILPTQFHQAQMQARQSSPIGNTSAPSSSDFTTTSPLDLSSNPQTKRLKLEPLDRSRSSSPARDPLTSGKLAKSESAGNGESGGGEMQSNEPTRGHPTVISRHCQAQSEEINSWTVDDVAEFVGSIDICAEYVKNFREQCIDGSGLPLLTEEHLTNSLGMKLGPALKLRSILAKKLGGPCPCVSCTTLSHQSHLTAAAAAVVSSALPSSSSSSSSSSSLGPHTQTATTTATTTSNTASVNQSSTSCSNIPRPASADSGS